MSVSVLAAGTYADELEQIRRASSQLLSHSEKATVPRNLVNDGQQRPHDLSEPARAQTRRVGDEPPARVQTTVEDGVTVVTYPLVTTSVEGLFERALEHHDGPSSPDLAIGVRSAGDWRSVKPRPDSRPHVRAPASQSLQFRRDGGAVSEAWPTHAIDRVGSSAS